MLDVQRLKQRLNYGANPIRNQRLHSCFDHASFKKALVVNSFAVLVANLNQRYALIYHIYFFIHTLNFSLHQVQWFKERTQLGDHDSHYATSYVHGVCTLEITACEPGDSGLFRCSATNPLGSDETTGLLHVEGRTDDFSREGSMA